MRNPRPVLIALTLTCLLGHAAPCETLPGAQESSASLQLLLQQQHTSTKHVIQKGKYSIRTEVSHCLAGKREWSLEIRTLEPGVWSPPEVQHGKFLERLEDRLDANSTSEFYRRFRFRLKEDYLFQPINTLFRQELTQIESGLPNAGSDSDSSNETTIADKTKTRNALLHKAARKRIVEILAELGTQPHALRPPHVANNPSNPLRALESLCNWKEVDRLFTQTQISPPDPATDRRIAECAKEILEVVAGRLLTKPRLLTSDQLASLRAALAVKIESHFRPSSNEGQDVALLALQSVGFAESEVRRVLWKGELEPHHLSRWLKLHGQTELVINKTGKDQDYAWCVVYGEDNSRFIRVTRDAARPVKFEVQVDTSLNTGHSIVIETEQAGSPTFPF